MEIKEKIIILKNQLQNCKTVHPKLFTTVTSRFATLIVVSVLIRGSNRCEEFGSIPTAKSNIVEEKLI
jgi:hypothetical protein